METINPMVSIIVPVYNAEKYLKQCINSILAQTVSDFELICVDDGSTDNSLNILKKYQKKDKRIQVYAQKNQYAGIARNNGLSHANGKYVLFLDSDDFFENTLIEKTVALANMHSADLVLFGADIYDQSTGKYSPASWELNMEYMPKKKVFNKEDIPEKIFQVVGSGPCNKLYRRSFIEEHMLRFPDLRNSEDVPFVCGALASANIITYCTDELLHIRREHGTNLESQKDTNPLDFYKAFILLKEYLLKNDYYSLITKSFINRSFDSCIYQINSLRTATAKKEVVDFLFDTGFRELEIVYKPYGYFYNAWNVRFFQSLCKNNNVDWEQLTPKISVIVPVYNVERYLPQCIESIQKQTLKNLEIILVDDGSTDSSGDICDRYAKDDDRIVVIHKENGGLSDARNAGLDIAKSEFIGFVDSDDYIAENMYEMLYNNMLANDSDIAIGDIVYVNEYGVPLAEINNQSPMKDECLSSEQAQYKLIEEQNHYYVVVWSKLYRRKLFKDLRFEKGKIHEDEFLVHHIFAEADMVSTVKAGVYYYRQREASITTKPYSIKRLDGLEAFYDRVIFYRENMQLELAKKTEDYWVWFVLQAYNQFVFEDEMFAKRFFSLIERTDNEIGCILANELISPHSREKFALLHTVARHYNARIESKVTLIIPHYTTDYIRSINALLQQSLKEIEIICVIDAIDNAQNNLLLEIADKNNHVVLLPICEENREKVYNIAIAIANGKYVTVYNSENMFQSNDSLASWYIQAVTDEAAISRGAIQVINDNGFVKEVVTITVSEIDNTLYALSYLKDYQIYFVNVPEYCTPNLFCCKANNCGGKTNSVGDIYVASVNDKNTVEKTVAKNMLQSALDVLLYTSTQQDGEKHGSVLLWLEEAMVGVYSWDSSEFDKELLDILYAIKYAVNLELLSLNESKLQVSGYPLKCLDLYLNRLARVYSSEEGYTPMYNSLSNINTESAVYEKKGLYRLIRGGIRCYQEHGLKYTIRRILEKIVNKLGAHV